MPKRRVRRKRNRRLRITTGSTFLTPARAWWPVAKLGPASCDVEGPKGALPASRWVLLASVRCLHVPALACCNMLCNRRATSSGTEGWVLTVSVRADTMGVFGDVLEVAAGVQAHVVLAVFRALGRWPD